MRPVLLEMTGFASFREHALVDFTDADYFAIVGPTGSGKSTLVDAMTFALFGSAPRWGRRNAVAMALSPHGNRAVVRLVFELAGQRYVVAREVRRTGASVTTRNQRLERLLSPDSLGAADENTEVIAADSAVSAAVEHLLGLNFEQFRQCVVLPQNAFAEFLHSTPTNRQQILLRLIGAERYEQVQERANQRAAAARERVDHLDQRLGELADATEEVQRAAEAQEHLLSELVNQVRAALPGLATAQGELATALRTQEQLTAERDRLAAITVPDQVADLDRAVAAAQQEAAQAAQAQAQAEAADTRAREALAAAPDRGPLEQALKDAAELDRITAELPRLGAENDRAAEEHTRTGHRATEAELERTRAQATHDRVAQATERAREQVADLTGRLRLLQAPALPDGLAELEQELTDARGELADAEADLAGAEKAEESAQQALTAGPPRAKLERARRVLEDRAALDPQLTEARERLAQARSTAGQRAAAVQEQTAALRAAQQRRDEARRRHTAAALREHLTVGQDCPVCTQPVTTLPAPTGDPTESADGPAATDAALEAALETARAAQTAAARAESAAESTLEGLQRQFELLTAEIPRACPDLDTARALLTELEGLEAARDGALNQMRRARARADAARRTLTGLSEREHRIRTELGRTRDPLVALGAPEVAELPLTAAWRELTGWAADQAGAAATALTAAEQDAQVAETGLRRAADDLARARAAEQEAGQAGNAALARAERARLAVEQAEQRAEHLRTALATAVPVEQARHQLAEIDALEARMRAADTALRQARQTGQQAAAARDALDDRLAGGWAQLRRVRDDVVHLGAPEPDTDGLLAAWTGLTGWSSAAAADRRVRLEQAEATTRAHRERSAAARDGLLDLLARHGIPQPGEDLAGTALAAATGAHAAAAAALERVRERRTEAEQVLTDRAATQHTAHVAKMLGDLLRSDKFPRWLATSALEGLVIEASDTLLRLSDGQFDLDHDDRGELVVVDHADADARRSVKTLSGGETFQASLAMALALSSQMSQLSSAGGARLDSIFLDEGFGTLDPDTLETVAGTLENLARGERMVGVITHVPALADRVPVRFSVRRDAQTSTVERQNL